MARLPDVTALGQRPVPDSSGLQPLRVARVAPGPRDTVENSAEQAGADLSAATAMVEDTNRRQDTVVAEDAFNRLRQSAMDLENGQSGFRRVQGAAVVGQKFVDDNMANFDSTAARISDGLQTPQQKQLFQQRAQIASLQYRSSLLEHQSVATSLFNKQTTEGTVDLELRNIAQHPNDSGVFQAGLARIARTLNDDGQRNGRAQELTDSEIAQKRDAAYTARILATIEGVPGVMGPNPYGAKALFETVQDQLGPKAQVELAAHINAAVAKTNDANAEVAIQRDPSMVFSLTGKALGVGGPSTGGALPTDGSAPRGIRNNNPGNIRKSNAQWEGQVPGTDAEFVQFESPAAGIRALAKNLISYQDTHGLDSVRSIVSRWAPSSENDTAGYVQTVAKQLGVDPDKALDLHDPGTLAKVSNAIIGHENGTNPYPQQMVVSSAMAALGLSRLNPPNDQAFTGPAAPISDIFSGQRAKTGVDFVDNAPTAQVLHWRQMAHTEMQRTQATARANLAERVKDVQSMTLSGTVPPPESIPTMRDYAAAGFDAHRYNEDITDYLRLGGGIQALQTGSAQERADLLARFVPAVGEGFDRAQKLYGALVQANQLVEKQIATDPAAYAMRYAPKVQAAAQTMQQVMSDKNASPVDRSAAVNAYVTATTAEQQRLGISTIKADVLGEGAKKRQLGPRILTNGQANAIAAQFQSSPANGAQIMDGLQQQWGSAFPQVYGQLAQDDKLPPSATVIPNMSDPFAKETLARLSEPDAVKGLKERMPPGAEKDINAKLLSLNEGFFGSLAYQDGGQKTYNTVVDQQRLLAMAYLSQGKGVGDAAKLAFEQTVGHAYDFSDTLRIPKTQLPDQVLGGTRVIRNKADMLDMAIPPSFRAGLTDTDRRNAWVDAVRSGATFVANADESGASLYVRAKNDNGRDALFAVRSGEGNQLSWSWSRLRGLYNDQPGAASSDTALQQALAKGDRATAEAIQRDRARLRYQGMH